MFCRVRINGTGFSVFTHGGGGFGTGVAGLFARARREPFRRPNRRGRRLACGRFCVSFLAVQCHRKTWLEGPSAFGDLRLSTRSIAKPLPSVPASPPDRARPAALPWFTCSRMGAGANPTWLARARPSPFTGEGQLPAGKQGEGRSTIACGAHPLATAP